jgi:hypothetical protein
LGQRIAQEKAFGQTHQESAPTTLPERLPIEVHNIAAVPTLAPSGDEERSQLKPGAKR